MGGAPLLLEKRYQIVPKGIGLAIGCATFDAAIRETRDDPALMDATDRWPAYDELSYASKNFFYAHINEDDPRVRAAWA